MNYFLVDYENVNISGLNGISKLTADDVVIIFYSENAETLTFGMHRKLNESKAEIKFQKVTVKEKNALDFQLCTYLGFLIRDTMSEENNYFIVSNDKSFSVLPNYCNQFKIDLQIVSDLVRNEIKNLVSEDKIENVELQEELSKILTDKNEISTVMKIIKNFETKIDIHNNLEKVFADKGKNIYQVVKRFIADKK